MCRSIDEELPAPIAMWAREPQEGPRGRRGPTDVRSQGGESSVPMKKVMESGLVWMFFFKTLDPIARFHGGHCYWVGGHVSFRWAVRLLSEMV